MGTHTQACGHTWAHLGGWWACIMGAHVCTWARTRSVPGRTDAPPHTMHAVSRTRQSLHTQDRAQDTHVLQVGVHMQHVDAQALPRTHNGRTVAVTCWRLGADGSLRVRAIFYENWGRFGGRDGRPCVYVCAHVHVRPSKPEGFHFCTKWKCKVIENQWLSSFKPTFRQCDLNFCNPMGCNRAKTKNTREGRHSGGDSIYILRPIFWNPFFLTNYWKSSNQPCSFVYR